MKPREHGGLRIAYLIQSIGWDPDYQGGDSVQIQHVLRWLRSAGHHVTLVASRPNRKVLLSSGTAPWLLADFGFSSARVPELVERGARRFQSGLRLPWLQVFDSLRLYDACGQHLRNCDLLHERNSMYGFGVALASRRFKLPYVLSVDADFLQEHDYLGISHTRLEREIVKRTAHYNYRAAHAITTVSDETKQHLVSCDGVPEGKVYVIPNGAEIHPPQDQHSLRVKRAELHLDRQPIVMFVGSFNTWHGIDILVDAFKSVVLSEPRARLLLVGDGETHPAIEKLVQQSGLADQVTSVGRIAHQEVPLFLELADVVVAPYPRFSVPFWGSPLKIFEYMAAGKAIVASRVGQIAQVLKHRETALLVEPGDGQAMAAAILQLLASTELRNALGRAARRTAERHHSWQKFVERLEEVYDRAIAGAHREWNSNAK